MVTRNEMLLKFLPARLAEEVPQIHSLGSAPLYNGFKDCDKYVSKILRSCFGEEFPGGLLCRPVSNGLDFYLIAPTPADWRRLRPLAMAYVGQTITSFNGQPGGLLVGDPFDDWLVSQKFHATARVKAPNWRYGLAAMAALAKAGEKKPATSIVDTSSASGLLQRFRYAISSRDRGQAEFILDRIRAEGHLDALNVQFLHIQLLASFNRWAELRGQEYFAPLCQTRRPGAVTTAMIQALYRTDFERHEDDAILLKERFQYVNEQLPGSLFDSYLLPDTNEDIAKSFLLSEVTSNEPSLGFLRELRDEAEEKKWSTFSTLFEALAEDLLEERDESPETPLEILDNILTSAPTIEGARELVLLSCDIDLPDIAQRAVDYVNLLSSEDFSDSFATGYYSILWNHLKTKALSGWGSWFSRLDDDAFVQYESVALNAVSNWPIEKEISDAEAASVFVSSLNDLRLETSLGRERFAQCLPIIMQWAMSGAGFPCPHMASVYVELMTFFSLEARLSEEALAAFASLFDGALRIGVTKDQYELAVESALELCEKAIGQRSREWLFEMLELIVMHDSPNKPVRDQFLWKACESFQYMPGKLSDFQAAVLSDIAESMGVAEDSRIRRLVEKSIQGGDDKLWTTALDGKHIAIYSLTESAALRASRLLEKNIQNVKVTVCVEKAGSKRLKTVAQNADIMVLVWRSAKHAATEFIEKNRSDNAVTLYSKGKGSASIIRELEVWGTN